MYKVLLAILTLTLTVAFAQSPVRAESGKSVVQDLVTLFSGWSGDEDDKTIYDAAAKHIDYQQMAIISVGDNQWAKLNATQKREFVSALRHLVEYRYYPRWHRIFHHGKLTYLSEAPAKNEYWVKTDLHVGKKDNIITWRLHANRNSGDLMVISLTVGERDLLTKMTTRFQKQIAKSGIEGLLVWLKDKLDIDPNESINSTAMSLI